MRIKNERLKYASIGYLKASSFSFFFDSFFFYSSVLLISIETE